MGNLRRLTLEKRQSAPASLRGPVTFRRRACSLHAAAFSVISGSHRCLARHHTRSRHKLILDRLVYTEGYGNITYNLEFLVVKSVSKLFTMVDLHQNTPLIRR